MGGFGRSKPFRESAGTRSGRVRDAKKRPRGRFWDVRDGPRAPGNWPKASLGRSWPSWGGSWANLAVLALALNWDFARFLAANGGWALAAGGLLYHQIYYVYSAGAFVWSLFEYHILRRRDRLHVT